MRDSSSILITGGAGFIGSALVRYLINSTNHRVLNIDKLTYAGDLRSLESIASSKRYAFTKVDIINRDEVQKIFDSFKPNIIFHLAAESHVDRSINDPMEFIKTNILGTAVLLDVACSYHAKCVNLGISDFIFHHISTDEVYGSLSDDCFFTEDTAYDPSSPYSASKASSDHLVRAWGRTYNLPYIVTNCSNNYGPYQFPEKLIPLVINKVLRGEKIPIYGDGKQIRDWLHVEDHVEALYHIASNGELGETYNIGGNNQKTNLQVVRLICDLVDKKQGFPLFGKSSKELITFVQDRPGHDLRYAIDASKLKERLGWSPSNSFEKGLANTVDWYFERFKEGSF